MTGPDKTQLRKLSAARRAEEAALAPDGALKLIANFPAALTPQPGQVVAGYSPFATEIDPRPLMQALACTGARLALPVTPPRGSDQPLTFRAFDPGQPLAPGHFGVAEPSADAEIVEPDLILVPLLAFDASGHRLGWGAGHYDRTLQALRARRAVVAIGLAYAGQAFEALPADPHDQKLDGVLTERAYIGLQKDQ